MVYVCFLDSDLLSAGHCSVQSHRDDMIVVCAFEGSANAHSPEN